MDEDQYTRITLRIPRELHTQLAEAAASTSKSMNAEIVARLSQSFAPAPGKDLSTTLGILLAEVHKQAAEAGLKVKIPVGKQDPEDPVK